MDSAIPPLPQKVLWKILSQLFLGHLKFHKYWENRNAPVSKMHLDLCFSLLWSAYQSFADLNSLKSLSGQSQNKTLIQFVHYSYRFHLFTRCKLAKFYALPRGSEKVKYRKILNKMEAAFEVLKRYDRWEVISKLKIDHYQITNYMILEHRLVQFS